MAGFQVNMDDIFKVELSSSFEQMAVQALNEAAPIMVDAVKQSLSDSASRGYSIGDTVRSIKASKPRRCRTDAYLLVVRPTGKDAKGVRNMEKAMYLEYGTTKEAARPWLQNASKNAEAQALEKMQEVFNRAMGI